ncbi:uncharacterized protein PV09_03530 [Verruconis gallopava]|uniref:CAP20 n=1 Tax=Verruconis gallopava TaxID=253628 RepID=A0A0D1XSD3_9PEZI|nr:uncharacterized protein PV09_03530 [Verruconis gallopava]KIW05666.1 hypothetical protein PV09_03530 [Verruconis gallopava]
MPHAEENTRLTNNIMGEPLTNGEKPHSLFISHLTSYPLVSDSLSLYLENPYGAKSVNLFNEAYKKFLTPVEPYLKTPYSYIAPYLEKADSLGDKGLSEVDSRFPIVKEETSSLKERIKNLPYVPYSTLVSTKDYLFKTFDEQSKKNEGKGVVPLAKTIIGTELKIAADTLSYVSTFLTQKKEEGKKFADAKAEELKEKTSK